VTFSPTTPFFCLFPVESQSFSRGYSSRMEALCFASRSPQRVTEVSLSPEGGAPHPQACWRTLLFSLPVFYPPIWDSENALESLIPPHIERYMASSPAPRRAVLESGRGSCGVFFLSWPISLAKFVVSRKTCAGPGAAGQIQSVEDHDYELVPHVAPFI